MSDTSYISKWLVREPPHFVRSFEDLVTLYEVIRDKYQAKIDQSFDAVSAQIGFVVTTMLPVTVVIDPKKTISAADLGEESLRSSIFGKQFAEVLDGIKRESSFSELKPGDYNIILFWNKGLQAIFAATKSSAESMQAGPTPQPAIKTLPGEAAVLFSAIDKVYPDLNLGRRLSDRYINADWTHRIWTEPAHFQISDLVNNLAVQIQART